MTESRSYADLGSVMAPSGLFYTVQPDDEDLLPYSTKALYVGGGGNLVVSPVSGGPEVTFHNVPEGSILDIRVRAVRATGTTATHIVALC